MSAETFYEEPQLFDSLVGFDEDRSTGELIIKREQHIDDAWLAEIAKEKVDSANRPCGDMYRVASIPVEIVDELYRRYGFDVMTAPARETLAMLNKLAFDHFITTTKSI